MSVNRNSLSGGTAPYSNSENPSKTPLAATISKALSSQSAWPDKEEFLDVIYWLRQIVGVLLGLIWGVIAIQVYIKITLNTITRNQGHVTPPLSIIYLCLHNSFIFQGLVGIVLFAAINAGLLYLYFSGYQSVDEEEYGGVWELTKEGFVTSFASFLVMWIIVYTGLHFD